MNLSPLERLRLQNSALKVSCETLSSNPYWNIAIKYNNDWNYLIPSARKLNVFSYIANYTTAWDFNNVCHYISYEKRAFTSTYNLDDLPISKKVYKLIQENSLLINQMIRMVEDKATSDKVNCDICAPLLQDLVELKLKQIAGKHYMEHRLNLLKKGSYFTSSSANEKKKLLKKCVAFLPPEMHKQPPFRQLHILVRVLIINEEICSVAKEIFGNYQHQLEHCMEAITDKARNAKHLAMAVKFLSIPDFKRFYPRFARQIKLVLNSTKTQLFHLPREVQKLIFAKCPFPPVYPDKFWLKLCYEKWIEILKQCHFTENAKWLECQKFLVGIDPLIPFIHELKEGSIVIHNVESRKILEVAQFLCPKIKADPSHFNAYRLFMTNFFQELITLHEKGEIVYQFRYNE